MLAAFAVALAALAALAACERRHPHPVMPLAFFSSMRSAGPLLSMLVVPAGQVGFLFFTTLLTQQVLGFTPIQTGLALVPFTVGLIATNQLTPRLLPRLGERAIGITGLSGLALGITWMALVAADAGPGTSIVTVLLPSILLGAGAGATFAPVTAVIMHQAPLSTSAPPPPQPRTAAAGRRHGPGRSHQCPGRHRRPGPRAGHDPAGHRGLPAGQPHPLRRVGAPHPRRRRRPRMITPNGPEEFTDDRARPAFQCRLPPDHLTAHAWTVTTRAVRPRTATTPDGTPVTIHDTVLTARHTR
ncbi:MFS transporter [Streptosporangium lutulentum]